MSETQHWPGSGSLAFLEGLYEQFLRDPQSVPQDYRRLFERLEPAKPTSDRPFRTQPSFEPRSLFHGEGPSAVAPGAQPRPDSLALRQHCVDQLVRNYRVRGHMIARINPLGLDRPVPEELQTFACGLTEEDLDRIFVVDQAQGRRGRQLRRILEVMRNTYCRSIGVQFMHIDALAERRWLQGRMEDSQNRLHLSRDEQLRILTRLTDATIFEQFIQKKYVGAKSFSLEGAESLIPLLELAIEKAASVGVDEIVLGMAHRGRLNVLANIMGKSPTLIFREFEDPDPDLYMHGGDVKYHQGYSSDWTTAAGGKVHLSLCFNPSHLEFINPVALGRTRAKQDRAGDRERRRKLCLLVHGDAGFAGEGIVQETLNLGGLAGYSVGGTIHVIVDNQIGFTATPAETRATTYATAVARMLQSPIFHVNGEDPEAVAQVIRLAIDFRQAFQRDVFIDMHCYRRHGHNESDEPRFTQPILYQAIDARQSVREGYLEHLLALGGVGRDEADQIAQRRTQWLEEELTKARDEHFAIDWQFRQSIWSQYLGGPERADYEVDTAVPRDRLIDLLGRLTALPDSFHPHPKLKRFFSQRREMADGQRPIDWSSAEALAIATLASQGHRVRLSGQDSARGTFSQRHGVLHDVETGQTYCPLAHVSDGQAAVEIVNSPLCEAGVLGYEWGYSLDCPEGLIVWEAQFGDFANAAQVIIDQFIASAQDKWCRLSGLVMLLPHALEGMGPEHSSARLERFLQLAAADNIQIVYPTLPGQFFHLLRRQVLRCWRKPLVVMTPKSLLRHSECVSDLAELAEGRFERVLPDASTEPIRRPRRVLLCSGKVYFDLAEQRRKIECDDVPLVRVEQLYPLAADALASALADVPDDTPAWWVQEEPENMGAWRFVLDHYGNRLLGRLPLEVLSRPAMTTPASGSAASYKAAQEQLVRQAFE